MIKLSDKTRRVLRKIYQGLGAATISLLFQACYGPAIEPSAPAMYGMPPDDDVMIRGKVSSKTYNAPIKGIEVSIENYPSSHGYTNKDGVFIIDTPWQNSYDLKFEDVDGTDNGSYKTKTISIDDASVYQEVQLDEADEE